MASEQIIEMSTEFVDPEDSNYSMDHSNLVDCIETDQICRACESTDIALDLADKENHSLLQKFRACVDIEVSKILEWIISNNIRE